MEYVDAPAMATEEQWQAIIRDDAAYDGRFFYAVKTTGIFCRPSCKSRPPRRDNIGIFQAASQAQSAGYRPCKRCKPTGDRLPDEEWIAVATGYIDQHFMDSLTLESLADICHGSPYHLHRTFKKVTGMTPTAYIQRRRIEHAMAQLTNTNKPIHEIGRDVGIPNAPYFATLFKKLTGNTPASFRNRYSG